MGPITMRSRCPRKQRWKCRSDGKHGTIKLSHASHTPWKSQKKRFHTLPPHDDYYESKGHFNFAQLATFLLCSNNKNRGNALDAVRTPFQVVKI